MNLGIAYNDSTATLKYRKRTNSDDGASSSIQGPIRADATGVLACLDINELVSKSNLRYLQFRIFVSRVENEGLF
jgi:hypothetical protein